MSTRHDWQDAIEAGDVNAIRAMASSQEIDKIWIHGTPIDWAIMANQPASVTTLLDLGATVHSHHLMAAAHGDTPEIIGILLDHGAQADAQDQYGDTALMKAARKGNAGCVNMLLSKGANPDLVDRHGQTALHHALVDGNQEICQALAAIVDISVTDKIGWNYLMYAAIQQRTETCHLLMERGIPLDGKAPDGRSLAQLCAPTVLASLATWQKSRNDQTALEQIAERSRPGLAHQEPRRKPGL